MLLLGNIGQQFDIQDAQAALAEMQAEVAQLRAGDDNLLTRLKLLERENDELKLCLAAVMRLLQQKGLVDRDQLKAIAGAIDRSDGRMDGRYTGPILPD